MGFKIENGDASETNEEYADRMCAVISIYSALISTSQHGIFYFFYFYFFFLFVLVIHTLKS
jgi:hypothetical protein